MSMLQMTQVPGSYVAQPNTFALSFLWHH